MMPELHQLIKSKDVHKLVHGDNSLGRFNAKLAVFITKNVGTMWCAYAFVLIACVSLPQALNALINGDTVTGISWLSQSLIQLVLLPVILVGQNTISQAQDARAETDHTTLNALHKINLQQLEILELLHNQKH